MKAVIDSFKYGASFLETLVADLSEEEFRTQSAVACNHPAWTVGHLAHSFQALGGEIGIENWLPEEWESWFGTGSSPEALPADRPRKHEMLEAFRVGRTRLEARLAQLTEVDWGEDLPDERFRRLLPTKGQAITQILLSHLAYHIGQLVMWRQSLGMAQLKHPFL